MKAIEPEDGKHSLKSCVLRIKKRGGRLSNQRKILPLRRYYELMAYFKPINNLIFIYGN